MNKPYTHHNPKRDAAFKRALFKGRDALNKLYESAAWNAYLNRYTAVVILDLVVERLKPSHPWLNQITITTGQHLSSPGTVLMTPDN